MFDFQFSASLFLCLLPLLCFFFFNLKKSSLSILFPSSSSDSNSSKIPTSYPFIGSYFTISANNHRRVQWTSDVVLTAPNLTFTLHRPFGNRQIFTANPSIVQHILKTNFQIYQKGEFTRNSLFDFLGDGIFNVSGDKWKFQRQLSSHEFNTKSLKKFVETVVDTELSDRLIPILADSAVNKTVIDFQDILQRFAFDNICAIAFGYDPAYLLPSLPQAKFAVAFDDATRFSGERLNSPFPVIWKLKKLLNIGSEKQFRTAMDTVHRFAKEIVKQKKEELKEKSTIDSVDLLSRFLNSGHSDEDFVTDIVISFILAGRDTTSSALTWFFWILSKNPEVEKQILNEISEKTSESSIYDEVKDMIYTHASLCESMRLYPPVPVDSKEAVANDVLPDGTRVKKGNRVTYHPYAMGRVKEVWGSDWAEFRPQRWLEWDSAGAGNWNFVARDAYTYPVFQAGPRICLGREMAFLQMKRVVAGVLRRFRVIPAMEEGEEPVFVSFLTSRMRDGFPVKIEERVH
ncbi:hypothetical protein M9H77_01354 [Catharanthus roseus]|uniref:Uncharacterized protein n=1 Tax=Catharanthus roseus TaxID=4058 RepID=A0ACC0C5J6_CATRO|nr:hypothetical protein M9H77_01354 [Catharanthus roseus]